MFDLQKASMTKRISAFILDLILVLVLTTGFGTVISWVTHYDDHYNTCKNIISKYETQFNSSYYIDEIDYLDLSDAEQQSYQNLLEAIASDEEFLYHNKLYFSLTLVIISLGIFFAVLVIDFIFPLIFKDGKTPGKKIFSLGVMRTNHTKVTPVVMFIRTLLGKYTTEIMIPVLLVLMIWFGTVGIVGTIVILGMLILQIICLAVTKTNSCIHDLFADTVVIDFPSQKIFDSNKELIAAKEAAHSEAVKKSVY